GANITDLAQLKYKNIDGLSIIFIRQKRAHRKQDFTVIAMTQEIARLIEKLKQPYKSEETYILDILKENMTAKQRLTAIRNTVRGINKHIKVIAANIGISTNITTYTARHTHATVKRDAGYSALQIAEDMGTSEKVVKRNYISNTDLDKKHQMAAILTNWDDG
ncbi:MAG: hypothetical protein Q8S18_00005, partial [Bacteroidales bacterium]|nr:hypothetical protein [Bacteroidales bacterium]